MTDTPRRSGGFHPQECNALGVFGPVKGSLLLLWLQSIVVYGFGDHTNSYSEVVMGNPGHLPSFTLLPKKSYSLAWLPYSRMWSCD